MGKNDPKARIYEQTEIPGEANLTHCKREKPHEVKNHCSKDVLRWNRHLLEKVTFSLKIDMRLETHIILFPPINTLFSIK